jgi:predicted Zn-dependent peptidase
MSVMRRVLIVCALAGLLSAVPLSAQQVPVQEHVLPNGMKLLMVPRRGSPNIAAGWVAKVGSVNERPGITGLSHLFEHMMFKGTRAIGTSNIEADLKVMEQMDAVKAEIRKEERVQLERLRLGEISDLKDPKNRTPRHSKLLEQLADLEKRQKDLLVKNEFDRIYTAAGASGMNAGTDHDYTIYFINVPSNKLELWFWMESDRLMNPVFREFYAERDVVYEERRMRTDSTPTGKFEEEFDSLFWTSSPYEWPVVGWPSDLDGITREEALQYFAVNYAPNNLAAVLVGDFEPARAKELADRYFARLKRNPVEPQPVRTREVEQLGEKRMIAYADTNPQVDIRFHSVADGHKDEPALVVLGELLSGRTGRLYRSLVLDQKIANSAGAGQNGFKWEGYFSLHGVAKPGTTPEQVETALYREVEKLQKEKPSDRELRKVKNREAADSFRRVQSNFELMLRLLLAENGRGWRSFNEDPKKIEAVTADDVQRVANTYFKPENRAVAVYYTKKGQADDDPLLTGLNDQEKAQVRQFRGMLGQMPMEQARAMLQQIEAKESSAPPEQKNVLLVVKKLLQQKIEKGGK